MLGCSTPQWAAGLRAGRARRASRTCRPASRAPGVRSLRLLAGAARRRAPPRRASCWYFAACLVSQAALASLAAVSLESKRRKQEEYRDFNHKILVQNMMKWNQTRTVNVQLQSLIDPCRRLRNNPECIRIERKTKRHTKN